MAQTFTASVRGWTKKAKQNAELVVRGSTQDVGELMTRRQASVKDTGTYVEGRVPVDTGELINSQQVSINGGVIGSGDVSYAALVAGMDLGDVFQAVFTAEHARPMEYGVTGKFAGRFFVRNAVQQWPVIVEQNALQFRD